MYSSLGLTNNLIDSGQPRAKFCKAKFLALSSLLSIKSLANPIVHDVRPRLR